MEKIEKNIFFVRSIRCEIKIRNVPFFIHTNHRRRESVAKLPHASVACQYKFLFAPTTFSLTSHMHRVQLALQQQQWYEINISTSYEYVHNLLRPGFFIQLQDVIESRPLYIFCLWNSPRGNREEETLNLHLFLLFLFRSAFVVYVLYCTVCWCYARPKETQQSNAEQSKNIAWKQRTLFTFAWNYIELRKNSKHTECKQWID